MNALPIRVEGLRFRYGDMEPWVLNGVELEVQAGETLLLLGPSGCGKSTLALCLNGLIPFHIEGIMEGQVLIWGQSTLSQPVSELCRQVGEVFQDPETQLVMPRVAEEVAFGLGNLAVPREEMDARIDAALEIVGLLERRQDWVETLSGGQKQRLALAAVLALNTSILVLDEPTSNLDPAGAASFYQTLQTLKNRLGVTIVLIEHQLDAALPLVDRVAVMSREGTIMVAGTPREVFGTMSCEIEKEGVWLPMTCQLAMALSEKGWATNGFPLSLEEAEEMMRRLIPHWDTIPARSRPEVLPQRSESDVPAIAVEGLSFAYPGGPAVLQDVHLRVEKGRFFALVGGNGSGKSTLAKHLVGLLRSERGSIHVLGQDARRLSRTQLARQIGYVFQNPEHQFVTERVADELAYSLRDRWETKEVERRVKELLYITGLEGYEEANPFALSQGQKRRLSVATMMALEQPILILDEPTFGQDRHSTAALMKLLQSLHANGTTILFITHDMQLVAEYAEEVAVMHEGRILFQGAPAQLFRRQDILSQTSLYRPPLAELGRRMGHPELLTVKDWLAWAEASLEPARILFEQN